MQKKATTALLRKLLQNTMYDSEENKKNHCTIAKGSKLNLSSILWA
jgi:hypothetical protein